MKKQLYSWTVVKMAQLIIGYQLCHFDKVYMFMFPQVFEVEVFHLLYTVLFTIILVVSSLFINIRKDCILFISLVLHVVLR